MNEHFYVIFLFHAIHKAATALLNRRKLSAFLLAIKFLCIMIVHHYL